MSATILKALEAAEINIENARRVPVCLAIAHSQLHNAIAFLNKGYSPYDDITELLAEYPNPDDAPEKE